MELIGNWSRSSQGQLSEWVSEWFLKVAKSPVKGYWIYCPKSQWLLNLLSKESRFLGSITKVKVR